jgi:hypothetical protein
VSGAELEACVVSVAPLATDICRRLNEEIDKLGFPHGAIELGTPASAEYRLARDPASGADSLVGTWRNRAGEKCGELLFHADGSFYAEHDVVHPHPGRARWFVEAVTAWGRGSLIRSEPRLLRAPD